MSGILSMRRRDVGTYLKNHTGKVCGLGEQLGKRRVSNDNSALSEMSQLCLNITAVTGVTQAPLSFHLSEVIQLLLQNM